MDGLLLILAMRAESIRIQGVRQDDISVPLYRSGGFETRHYAIRFI